MSRNNLSTFNLAMIMMLAINFGMKVEYLSFAAKYSYILLLAVCAGFFIATSVKPFRIPPWTREVRAKY